MNVIAVVILGALDGSFMLVCIGLWIVIQTFVSKADVTVSETTMGFSEMMFIALAQGLKDLSIGFAAGFAKLNVLGIAL